MEYTEEKVRRLVSGYLSEHPGCHRMELRSFVYSNVSDNKRHIVDEILKPYLNRR